MPNIIPKVGHKLWAEKVGQRRKLGTLGCSGDRLPTMGAAQSTMRHEVDAEAAAEVAAALAAVGQAVRRSNVHTNLQKQTLLETLELDEDAQANANELKEQLKAAEAFADGEAGDRVKYVAAGRSMLKRWRLCLAIHNIDEAEAPTEAMAKAFTVFLFKCRQKRSLHGREGLGDSMGEMAQYTLAQVRLYG
jgi:hypothetical protein